MTRILIVEDSEVIRAQVRMALSELKCEILEGGNGLEGLKLLEANIDINLIITDLNMPELDGMEMCRRARQLPAYEKVPIFILTTEGSHDLKMRAREIGVTGWIVKPFKPEILLLAVKKITKSV